MSDCDHSGRRVYARRIHPNGPVHICVQCLECLDLVKLPEHGMRAFIKLSEVPAGKPVHEWIKPEDFA